MKSEALTLAVWPANAAKILDALLDIIEVRGGQQVTTDCIAQETTVYSITNRQTGETFTSRARNYVQFSLDGIYYYVQLDQNPFFGGMYTKEAIVGNRISRNGFGIPFELNWIGDSDKYKSLTNDQAKRPAAALFTMLLNAERTKPYPHDDFRRVQPIS